MRILDLWKAVIGGKAGHPKKAPAEGVGVDLPSKAGASDPYFELMGRLQVAYSNGDFEAARQVVQATLPQLRKFVKRWTAEYGTFDIASIPVLETGGRVLAILEDRETLELMAKEVRQLATLYPWRDTIEGHLADVEVVHRIRGAVGEQPGLLQNRLKFHLGLDDGRHLALIVGLLDKCGRLCRTRVKKTYALTLPGQPLPVDLQDAVGGTAGRSTALPSSSRSSSVVQSSLSPGHGKGRRTLQPREISLENLPYVSLPRAPARWEAKRTARRSTSPAHFLVTEGTSWELTKPESIPKEERPDPAYRRLCPSSVGMFLVDDLGKAERHPGAPSSLLSVDRAGEVVAEVPLGWDLYRTEVNPLGQGVVAVSRGGILHAYDSRLTLRVAAPLFETPEVRRAKKRFSITEDALKSHIRTAALSPDGSRYLFTIVDEAWCIGMDGEPRWGLRFPHKEGWARVSTPVERYGSSQEIDEAMSLMGLDFPVSSDDVKTKYRALAKQWHPDVSRGDDRGEKEEKFKRLDNAVELLSGLDSGSLAGDLISSDLFEKRIGQDVTTRVADDVTVTLGMSMVMSESHVADWIYAAAFSGGSNSVYLAGYSGKVVVIDEQGTPLRVLDIGAVPRRIADTGHYLYLLTDTRLYILRDEMLCGVIDVFEQGEVVVGQTGFGLLESKQFRWFSEEGRFEGGVQTKDPIRRIFPGRDGWTIETRQRRVVVKGAPGWWE